MIYYFKEKKIPALNLVGGKAKALIETTNAGFPVPEGFVLSVEFFSCWLDKVKTSDAFNTAMHDTNKENCDAVKAIAESLRFDQAQKNAFNKIFKNLQGDIFAVRSSSPDEDLDGTSFAGMYETYLGTNRSDIEKTVALAFSSCFDYRVIEYKKQNGLNLTDTSIAIIVQKQVASDVSGVGFSLNPLNNCYDEVVINASFGLGEAIVSGIVTPDTYIIDSEKNKIIERKISKKKKAVLLKPTGGYEEKENQEPKKQALTDKQILELSALIKKCEQHYGKPMDTEWAYEKNKLYLLQSRPITTYLPLFKELVTEPGEDKLLYLDIIGLTQGFADSMSVLGTELWANAVEKVRGIFFICSVDGTMPTLHGRQYLNLSYLYKAFGKKLVNKRLGNYDGNIKKIFDCLDAKYIPANTPKTLKGIRINVVKKGYKVLLSGLITLFGDYREIINKYNKIAEAIMTRADNFDIEKDFSQIADAGIKDFELVMNTFGIILAGTIAFYRIKRMFKGHNIETELAALDMDLDGNPTSTMTHLMYKIASCDEFQNIQSKEAFLKKITDKSYSREFLSDLNEFIHKYGVRGFKEIDIATKRTYEDMGLIYDRLSNINIEYSQITKVKQKRKDAYDKLYSIAKKGGFQKKFAKQSKIYQATFGYREHPKYILVYILARLHYICLKHGEHFVSEGRLNNAYQIFDLHKDEIASAQKDRNFDLHKAREKNLVPYKKAAHVKDWPLVINSRGKIFNPKIEINEGDLVGISIAPGKVRGRAKVLHSPYEKPLNPGEILVTKATEPSWTPIFINASGIIMEIGGPLQHGGIIAREYGIPCVSGLMGIMDIVKDGDLLEIDGYNGVVKILKS